MKKKWNWSQVLIATAAVAMLVTGSMLFAAKGGNKGKPDGGGEDPSAEPPPIIYALHRFTLPADYLGGFWNVQEINDVGELVGHFDDDDGNYRTNQAFYLDTNTGNTVATNLNDIQFDEEFGVPVGWYISRANGINNLGDIAGGLALEADPEQIQGCII